MPHSSGGGSHGGGSHGGSGHSSHSSSSHHSSSSPSHRVQSTYFPGARRFRYYRHGSPCYVYSDIDLRARRDEKPRWFLIIFYIPFLLAFIPMLFSSFGGPVKPIHLPSETAIVIKDDANIFTATEKSELEKELQELKKTTGVVPAVITSNNEKWENNYNSLENYAYDLYVNNFSDESHWLILYSQPESINSDFIDWYWEGMQGDNTDKVLDVFIDDFNRDMQKFLTNRSHYTVEEAIEKCFKQATNKFENQGVHLELAQLSGAFFGLAFIVIHGYLMIFAGTRKPYKYSELQEVYDDSPTYNYNTTECKPIITPNQTTVQQTPTRLAMTKCRYCGQEYQTGAHVTCPYCGATIMPDGY